MEETSSKLLLFFNVIDKGTAETHQLLQTLTEKVQISNRKQNNAGEKILQTISTILLG